MEAAAGSPTDARGSRSKPAGAARMATGPATTRAGRAIAVHLDLDGSERDAHRATTEYLRAHEVRELRAVEFVVADEVRADRVHDVARFPRFGSRGDLADACAHRVSVGLPRAGNDGKAHQQDQYEAHASSGLTLHCGLPLVQWVCCNRAATRSASPADLRMRTD